MTNLSKMFKLLWMRSRLWVLIFFIFALLIGNSSVSSEIHSFRNETTAINVVNLLYESDLDMDSQNIAENAFEMPYDESNFTRKYPEEYLTETYLKYQTILDRFHIEEVEDTYVDPKTSEEEPFTYLDAQIDNPEEYDYFLGDLEIFSNLIREKTVIDKASNIKYKLDFQQGFDFHLIVFILILSIILTSGEHLTSYYEFTRMFPWKDEESFIYKILYGFFFVLLLMLISFIFEYIMWQNSIYGNIITGSISWDLLLSILVTLAIFFIAMGTGAIAGNILGHIGLMIIAFFGISLIDINLTVFLNIFEPLRRNFIMEEYLNELPDFLLGFLDPAFGHMRSETNTNGLIYGMFALGIVYLLIGLYFSKNADVSKSKMLIMNKPVALLAKFLAIVSSTALITAMASVFIGEANIILGLLVYVIGLIISHKFYDYLFKIQLGA